MNKPTKVVYFDYWTKGVANFLPIDEYLKRRGIETLMLHIESFNFQCRTEEVVEGISCRDITWYKTRYIHEMLRRERPDVVLSLNTTMVLDRALVLACRSLGIRCVFMMHGVRNLGDSLGEAIRQTEVSYNSLGAKLRKLPKYATIMIPNYLRSLWFYDWVRVVNFRWTRVMMSYFASPGRSLYFPKYADEVIHDKCLVYSKIEREYYRNVGYPEEAIVVTGSPKLDKLHARLEGGGFGLADLPPSARQLVETGRRYALYLDEGLPEMNNFCGCTAEIRNKTIALIAGRLEKDGLDLIVKAHPSSELRCFSTDVTNVIVCPGSLDPLIYFSSFCLANISSTITNCAIMGKPVISPGWAPFDDLPDVFARQGVTRRWRSIDDPVDATVDAGARGVFLDKYVSVTKPTAVLTIVDELLASIALSDTRKIHH